MDNIISKGGEKVNKKEQNLIDIDDFGNVELKVASVVKVEEIEGADKLYKITVDLDDEKRTLVAGIKKHYSKNELEGKKVIVVSNLKPATLMGVKSEGMLLAAKNDNGLSILTLDKDIDNIVGSKVQ